MCDTFRSGTGTGWLRLGELLAISGDIGHADGFVKSCPSFGIRAGTPWSMVCMSNGGGVRVDPEALDCPLFPHALPTGGSGGRHCCRRREVLGHLILRVGEAS